MIAHHERWNGSGYPTHLKGRRIPLSARIVAIADTFDAITRRRQYSHARSTEIAREIILQGRGVLFDPELVDLFVFPPIYERIVAGVEAAEGLEGTPHRRAERGDAKTKTFRRSASAGVQSSTQRSRGISRVGSGEDCADDRDAAGAGPITAPALRAETPPIATAGLPHRAASSANRSMPIETPPSVPLADAYTGPMPT